MTPAELCERLRSCLVALYVDHQVSEVAVKELGELLSRFEEGGAS